MIQKCLGINRMIKNVKIEPGCTACGACEFIAPEVFEVKTISCVKKAAFNQHAQAIEDAAVACPVQVITIEKE